MEAELEAEACDGTDEADEEAEEATARNPKVARRPAMPTKAMTLAHEIHHADYRDWCPHCVAGKGVSHRHVSTNKGETPEAEFSMDYAFMTDEKKRLEKRRYPEPARCWLGSTGGRNRYGL